MFLRLEGRSRVGWQDKWDGQIVGRSLDILEGTPIRRSVSETCVPTGKATLRGRRCHESDDEGLTNQGRPDEKATKALTVLGYIIDGS